MPNHDYRDNKYRLLDQNLNIPQAMHAGFPKKTIATLVTSDRVYDWFAPQMLCKPDCEPRAPGLYFRRLSVVLTHDGRQIERLTASLTGDLPEERMTQGSMPTGTERFRNKPA